MTNWVQEIFLFDMECPHESSLWCKNFKEGCRGKIVSCKCTPHGDGKFWCTPDCEVFRNVR